MNYIKQKISALLPFMYLGIIVLVTSENVKWFYGLSVTLVVLVLALLYKVKLSSEQVLGYVLLVLGSIGIAASLLLTLEKFAIANNPDYVASCSVSPIVSCNSVIESDQAETVNGIPNPLFGVFGFSAIITAGMTVLAGAKKIHKYYWLTLFAGTILGSLFSVWLIFQSFYRINALCLYCMSVWYVSFTAFWFTLDFLIKKKIITLPKEAGLYISKNRNLLITASIGIVVLLIYFRWSDYWNGLI